MLHSLRPVKYGRHESWYFTVSEKLCRLNDGYGTLSLNLGKHLARGMPAYRDRTVGSIVRQNVRSASAAWPASLLSPGTGASSIGYGSVGPTGERSAGGGITDAAL